MRILVTGAAVLLTAAYGALAASLPITALMALPGAREVVPYVFGLLVVVLSAIAAFGMWRYYPEMHCTPRGAILGGALGLSLGMAWAYHEDSNLWPLFGLFFTGPVGFVAGAVLGAVCRRLNPPPLA